MFKPLRILALLASMALPSALPAEDLLAKHPTYLFCTDLEPDDLQAERQFLAHLRHLEQSQSKPVSRSVCFLVGEGHAPLKALRQKAYLDQFKAEGLLPKALEVQVMEGFSTERGPWAGFAKEGEEVLGHEGIEQARRVEARPPEAVLAELAGYLKAHPDCLVLALKPVREWVALYQQRPCLLHPHVFAAYGSYNFRCTFPKQPEVETTASLQALRERQQALVGMLNAFRASYVFENRFSTRHSNLSEDNAPAYFERVKAAKASGSLGAFHTLVANWNAHVHQADQARMLKILGTFAAAGKGDEKDLGAIRAAVGAPSYRDLPEAARLSLSVALGQLGQAVGEQDRVFLGLKRLVGKWKKITGGGLQLVSADPGLMAVLTGRCAGVAKAVPVVVAFKGDFTTLTPGADSGAKVFAFIPAGLTLGEAQKDDKALDEGEWKHFSDFHAAVAELVTEAAEP